MVLEIKKTLNGRNISIPLEQPSFALYYFGRVIKSFICP